MSHLRLRPLFSSVLLVGSALLLHGAAGAQESASLRGRAVDTAGRPVANAVIRLVSDETVHGGHLWRYTLIGDSLGKFRQEGLAPGAYLVMLFTDGRGSDVLQSVHLQAGETRQVDFTVGLHGTAEMTGPKTEASMMAGRR